MNSRIPANRAVNLLAAVAIAAIALAVVFLLLGLRARHLEHARVETLSVARMLTEQTEQSFEAVDLLLTGVQERLQTPYGRQFPLDGVAVHLLLSARASGLRQVRSVFIAGTDGEVLNSSHSFPAQRLQVGDRDYFQAFVRDHHAGLFVSAPTHGRKDGTWTLHLARRIDDTEGRFRGVVVAAINLAYFQSVYAGMKLDLSRPIALYLSDRTLIASLPPRPEDLGRPAPELGMSALPADGEVALAPTPQPGRMPATLALGRVSRLPLLVSVGNELGEPLQDWRRTAVPIAVGATSMCMLIAIAAAFLGRKLAREAALSRALREADDRYQLTVDSLMDAIVAVDARQRIVLFNPAAERMFGRPADAVLGTALDTLLPPRARSAHAGHVERFRNDAAGSRSMAPQSEITGLRADGSEFPIESTISHTLVDGKPQLTAVLRDVTERRRAERELREMNRELRRLSASQEQVREEERSRIARELHDELGQQLTGLKLELTWLGGKLGSGQGISAEQLGEMRKQLDHAIASVRRIATELRPVILDDLGFAAALKWQAEEFAKRSGVEVSLDLPPDIDLGGDAATALFRIVQESLTNVARHADARSVTIALAEGDGRLSLRIADDGRGLLLTGTSRKQGIGLLSMRERATALGGHLEIRANPGGGTMIDVLVPHTPPLTEQEEAQPA